MKTIGIIGLGVMGGSFAARLKQLGYEVIGFDLDEKTLDYARENKMIDQGFSDFEKGLPLCDTLIFCIYPSALKDWLVQWQDKIPDGTLILEISGVKRAVCESVHEILRPGLELVSIHPMCGKESRGITNASAKIFDGSNFILIPHESNDQKSMDAVLSLAREMGFGSISTLDCESHDRMIAFLSQLTHVIAVSLMNTHENSHLVEYTGDSFRDLTRIARINEDMWSELFLLNKDLLLEEITSFQDALQVFKDALTVEDTDEMKALMKQATIRREKFQIQKKRQENL